MFNVLELLCFLKLRHAFNVLKFNVKLKIVLQEGGAAPGGLESSGGRLSISLLLLLLGAVYSTNDGWLRKRLCNQQERGYSTNKNSCWLPILFLNQPSLVK